MFKNGSFYTRAQINAQVGGSLQSYLPNSGGRVVAACLLPDLNQFDPGAPALIFVGTGKGRAYSAELLIAQRDPVPTFLKRGTGRWEYVGDFRVDSSTTRDTELEKHKRPGLNDITRVIRMVHAQPLAARHA